MTTKQDLIIFYSELNGIKDLDEAERRNRQIYCNSF